MNLLSRGVLWGLNNIYLILPLEIHFLVHHTNNLQLCSPAEMFGSYYTAHYDMIFNVFAHKCTLHYMYLPA